MANSRFIIRPLCLIIFFAFKFTAVTVTNATNTTKPGLCPTEFDTINVYATDFFPYLMVNESDVFQGELKKYIQNSVNKCCSKIKLEYKWINITASDDIEMTVRKYQDSEPLMYFPVFAKRNEHKQFERRFLELYESAGFVVLQLEKETAIDNATKQLAALIETWPIVLMCILAATIAGILVWILECRQNEDFSSKFFQGAGSGIWWSFVTMTTVGYGDKSPKSAFARLFAILWMIIGTIMLSIFSAQITASLASFELEQTFSLQNKKVAVPLGMQNYLDKELNLGANYYEFSAKAITNATFLGNASSINGTPYVMLNDFEKIQTWLFDHNNTFQSTVIKTISHRMSLGVVLTHVAKSSEKFFDCWKQDVADQIAIDKLLKREQYRERLRQKVSSSASDSKSLERKIMIGLAGATGCLLVLGLIWELFRHKKYNGGTASADIPT